MIAFDEDRQQEKLKELLRREEENFAQVLGARKGIPYVDLTITPVNSDALRLIREAEARAARIVAFSIIDKRLKVAAHAPDSKEAVAVIESLKNQGYAVEAHTTSSASLEKAWKGYADLSFAEETKSGSLEISNEEIARLIGEVQSLPDVRKLIEDMLSQSKGFRISRIVETIVAGAIAVDASDIHIEPEESDVRLRYRLDGVLIDALRFDTDTFNLLLSRIKLLSGLKLNIHKEAQDGRFSVKIGKTEIEIRTSILPGAYRESIVLRVLNPKSIGVPLEELGMPENLQQVILHEIQKPNGMVLNTGPTGSGKTTTLYALLKKIHNPGVKIITIEDPIEYHLPGIVQTQVNDKGYTFLEGLRSALRQDPDIIMVGEIRDSETAQIAINSSLTGHLVLSTLHTNSAAGAFPRLIDLGINPKIMSSAINIVLAQRLVRRLCPKCRKSTPIEGDTKTFIESITNGIVDKSKIPNTTVIYTPGGCEECNNTGFKGRIGIYEGIRMTPEIDKTLDYGANERTIEDTAKAQGLMTMREDGIVKVLAGVTSIDELERVIELRD